MLNRGDHIDRFYCIFKILYIYRMSVTSHELVIFSILQTFNVVIYTPYRLIHNFPGFFTSNYFYFLFVYWLMWTIISLYCKYKYVFYFRSRLDISSVWFIWPYNDESSTRTYQPVSKGKNMANIYTKKSKKRKKKYKHLL